MRYIKLTNGRKALIDNEDYEYINQWLWRLDKHGYATRVKRTYIGKGKYKCTTIFMHREIAKTPLGKDTDHINRNRLDNRRLNLRIVTRSENNINSKIRRTNSSGFTGVSFHAQTGKWRAYISYKGRVYSGGLFINIGEAIKARKKLVCDIYGKTFL